MLAALGHDALGSLLDEVVPPGIRSQRALALPTALTEREALARLADFASRNTLCTSLIGMGYHATLLPGARGPTLPVPAMARACAQATDRRLHHPQLESVHA